MLRIKDNVDLKELEKFGLKKDNWGDYCKDLEIKSQFEFKVTIFTIMIDNTKHIGRIGYVTNGKYCLDNELDILYDLIQADLVEKVD